MPRRRNRCKNACEHNCKKLHMKACQRFARVPAARPGQKLRPQRASGGKESLSLTNSWLSSVEASLKKLLAFLRA
jgi:hypothetical protein